jgi:catalase
MAPGSRKVAEEIVQGDEAAVVAEFIEFLKEASARRHPEGPVRRFNQGRAAGCVEAEFTIRPDLPGDQRVGILARPATYRALIRFANASSASDRDKDVRGMSIKVLDVPGENLTPGGSTQDFVLNSHPVMMAADTRAFLELLRANEAGGLRRAWYFISHPNAARIAFASRQNPSCHLDIPYWSTTPYLFGPGRAVKYIARPSAGSSFSPKPSQLTDTYLGNALRARLEKGDAQFDFMIQFQQDAESMPIEDATVEWKEAASPYLPVAAIRIPRQRVSEEGVATLCEAAAFNPWHCLVEHRPLGSMNRARKEIYRALAAFRQERAAASPVRTV